MKKWFLLFTLLLAACGGMSTNDPIPSKTSVPGSDILAAVAEAERAYAGYVAPDSAEIRELTAASKRHFDAYRASLPRPIKFARHPNIVGHAHDPSPVNYIAVNNQVWLPASHDLGMNNHACYLTWIQGANGYTQFPTWPNGMPKNSSSWYVERWRRPNVVSAYWEPESGVRITQATCTPFDDFNNLGTTYQVPLNEWDAYPSDWGLIIRSSVNGNGQGPYDDDIALGFDTNSFCYPISFKGLTHGGTGQYVYAAPNASSPTGYSWRMRHYGSAATYAARANCVWLGRSIPYHNTYVAYQNQPAWMDSANQSMCYIAGVWGDLNSGAVFIERTNGLDNPYKLQVSGAVWGATATCVPYWHE